MKILLKKLIMILFILNFNLCITMDDENVDGNKCFEKHQTLITESLAQPMFSNYETTAKGQILYILKQAIVVAISRCVEGKEDFKQQALFVDCTEIKMTQEERSIYLQKLLFEISTNLNDDAIAEFFDIMTKTIAIDLISQAKRKGALNNLFFEDHEKIITERLADTEFSRYETEASAKMLGILQHAVPVGINRCTDEKMKEDFKQKFLAIETMALVDRCNNFQKLLFEVCSHLISDDLVAKVFDVITKSLSIDLMLADSAAQEEHDNLARLRNDDSF